MKKSPSLKSTIILVLGIDSLMIAIAVGRAILLDRNPLRYFGEGGFITWLSIIQLLFIAYLCWKISIFRSRKHSRLKGWKNPGRLWQAMTAGFIFLALDEYLQIHEKIDVGLQELANIDTGGEASRINDFIILLYAIIGLFFLWTFKNEFKRFTSAFEWFLTGFSFCSLTILLDMLTHNQEIFSFLTQDYEQLTNIHYWFKAIEEVPKIFAEGAFIVAFYYCLIIAKRLTRKAQKITIKQ